MLEFQKYPITVKFILLGHKRQVRDTYPVYASIVLHRKNSQISMKMFVKPEEWDSKAGRYIESKPYCIYANNKLMEERSKILQAYFELKKRFARPQLKAVINSYKGVDVPMHSGQTLLSFFNSHIEKLKQLPDQYSFGALEHYRKSLKHLENYLTSKGWLNIQLSELGPDLIFGFEHYLLTAPNPQTGGKSMQYVTATTYMRKIKAVVNSAVNQGILNRNPFLGHHIKREKKSTRDYLNRDELQALWEIDLGKNTRLDNARWFFLFGCYTGIRHGDLFDLRKENIRRDSDGVTWIRLVQQKTSDLLEVPMLKPAVEIYERYAEYREETGYVLPRFINQSLNRDLKLIMKRASITKTITTHSARHTMASTVALQHGMDFKLVSFFLGHANLASTNIYAKVSPSLLVSATKTLNDAL